MTAEWQVATTAQDLDALPTGSVIATEDAAWIKFYGEWYCTGNEQADSAYGLAAWAEPYQVLRYGDGTP